MYQLKFRNTWSLLCITLNNKSAYCFIPRSLSIPTNVNDVAGCSEIAPISFCLRTILDPRRTVLIGHFFLLNMHDTRLSQSQIINIIITIIIIISSLL